MKTLDILSDLYNGNVNPCDLVGLVDRQDYTKAVSTTNELREQLLSTLSSEQKTKFEDYNTNWDELSLIVEQEVFKAGFRLAVQIMTEVYNAG